MRRSFALALFAAASLPTAASAADRTYTVTSFDRVRIDGPFKVEVLTGVAPFAHASGSAAALDGVRIEVEGSTLYVRPNPNAYGGYPGEDRGPVVIMVGTHDLTQLWVNGSGSAAVERPHGLKFSLSVQGSGSAAVNDADVDQLVVGLAGTATAAMSGKVRSADIYVRGVSGFDGRALATKDAKLVGEGPATIALQVSGSAKVNALGVATIALSGSPACELHVEGSATVTGCPRR